MLPNFLIIGAQKSGTTAIAHYLSQHPQIYMSPLKEPGFFDFESSPPNFNGPGDQKLYSGAITNLNDYHKLFEGASNEIAIGEATTWYLYSRRAPKLIKSYIPDVKLIVVLRNPIDRAYSAYMHAVRDNREYLDFEAALQVEDERINDNWEYLWHYQKIGFYSEQIERYLSEFDKKQFKFFLFEDFKQDPQKLISSIYDFIGVEQTALPGKVERFNVSGKKRSILLDNFLKDTSLAKQIIRPFMPKDFRRSLAKKARLLNLQKQDLPQHIRKRLRDTYREDVLKLQKIIGRDLTHWLNT